MELNELKKKHTFIKIIRVYSGTQKYNKTRYEKVFLLCKIDERVATNSQQKTIIEFVQCFS